MTHTTIKVTSLNTRGNFSKLRKLSDGAKILKFLNSGQVYHGITQNEGSNWREHIFETFRQNINDELAAATTPELKQAVIDKYNNALTQYAALRNTNPDLAKVKYNQGVKDYQSLINSDFGFVNQNGIANGLNIGRYNFLSQNRFKNGDKGPTWNPDGWWGAQTQDRTTLGYKGDWDEDSKEYNDWQTQLDNYCIETFMDKDGAYKLRLKPDPEIPPETPPPGTPPPPTTPPPPETPPKQIIVPPVQEQGSKIPGFKWTPWTDFIPIGALSLTNAMSIIRNKNLANKTKFTLEEAPIELGRVENNYAARQARAKLADDVRTRALNTLSTDIDKNTDIYNQANTKADELYSQNILDRSTKFDQTDNNLRTILNNNGLRTVATANVNRKNNDAALNNIILNNQKANTALAENRVQTIAAKNKSHGDWLKDLRVNKNNYEQGVLLHKYNIASLNAYINSGLEALDQTDGVYNSMAYLNLLRNISSKNGLSDPRYAEIASFEGVIGPDNKISPDGLRNWYETEIQKENPSELALLIQRDFKKEYDSRTKLYENTLRKLNTDFSADKLKFNLTSSNQSSLVGDLFAENDGPTNYNYTSYNKSGGKITTKSRWVDYLEHRRKAENDYNKVYNELLKRQASRTKQELEALDKLTLLLLRSVFS